MFVTASFDNASIAVDSAAGVVTFVNCHKVKGILHVRTEKVYTCKLSELYGVCWGYISKVKKTFVSQYDMLESEAVFEVWTPTGKVFLPRRALGFDAVRQAITEGLAPGAGLKWHEYYYARSILFLGALLLLGVTAALVLIRVNAETDFEKQLLEPIMIGVAVLGSVAFLFLYLFLGGRSPSRKRSTKAK